MGINYGFALIFLFGMLAAFLLVGLVWTWQEKKSKRLFRSVELEEANQNFDFIKASDLKDRYIDIKVKSKVYNPRKDEDFQAQIKNETYFK